MEGIAVSKRELIEFIDDFTHESILDLLPVEESKTICTKGKILAEVETIPKDALIEKLIIYEPEGILELLTIDVLKKFAKKLMRDYQEKLKVSSKDVSIVGQEELQKIELSKSVDETKIAFERANNLVDVNSEENKDGIMGSGIEFSLHKDDWDTFIEQMEIFFDAKDIKAEKQRACLVMQVDIEAFKLVKHLVSPGKIGEKTYEDIMKIISEHLVAWLAPRLLESHVRGHATNIGTF